MKRTAVLLSLVTGLLLAWAGRFLVPDVHASYVLPYPSYMPGHPLYRVSRIVDQTSAWWHWGTIASISYHLGLSDKYLVEAKTLFEYKQYPLALAALDRSTYEFGKLPPRIDQLEGEGKADTPLVIQVSAAAEAHLSLLQTLRESVPQVYEWESESHVQTLRISDHIEEAIETRVWIE